MKFVSVFLLSLALVTCTSGKSQHIFVTTSVTTTTVTMIDVGICNESQDLYFDGTYLKTLCTVSRDLTYEQAKGICTEAGMHLFVINNSEVQKALQDAAGVRFLDRDYARLWVNGMKDIDGDWKTLDTKKRPVFHLLDWLEGDSTTGECLSILRRNKQNRMNFQGWTCLGIAWGYCEYTLDRSKSEVSQATMTNYIR